MKDVRHDIDFGAHFVGGQLFLNRWEQLGVDGRRETGIGAGLVATADTRIEHRIVRWFVIGRDAPGYIILFQTVGEGLRRGNAVVVVERKAVTWNNLAERVGDAEGQEYARG